jgi:hexosaminidase
MNDPRRTTRGTLAVIAILALAACRGGFPSVAAPAPTTALHLVPAPSSLALGQGAPFAITATTAIVAQGDGATAVAEALGAILRPPTGFPVPVTREAAAAAPAIYLTLRDTPALGDEGYTLTVASDGVRLVASRPAGLFRGMQTIRQLLPYQIESEMAVHRVDWTIPALTISDAPRFPWRGAMLDVARHFMTVKEVQQFIDMLALYKMNVLHLHLSDDQGWRIEIKSRPTLATVGGATQVGGGPGGFYTQEEYSGLVQYAAARFITVVPEIDMPAHSNAALVAFPDVGCSVRPTQLYTGTDVGWSTFCVDKEGTYALIDDVVREIAALTPGPFFHVGGDEVQALTREQYVRFVERVQDIVTAHGKRMVGWEEIAHAHLKSSTVAQQWKSDSAVLALQYGSKVLLSPANRTYLDMKYTAATELGLSWAALIEVRDAYDWNPAGYVPGIGEADILGVEAPFWSETLTSISAVQYMALPRLPALAEVGWTPQSAREWEGFRERVGGQTARWRQLGMNYYRSPQLPPE